VDISDPIYGEDGYSYAWGKILATNGEGIGVNCTGSILISMLYWENKKKI